MKEIIKFMIYILIIISPVIVIFHLLYDMLNYEYIATINNENIEMMKEKLLINDIEVKGELKEVKLHCIDWDEVEFILIYENDEIENYIVTEDEKSKVLSKYIIECSEKNDRLGLRFTIIIISIIASINTIIRLGKTEIIYED